MTTDTILPPLAALLTAAGLANVTATDSSVAGTFTTGNTLHVTPVAGWTPADGFAWLLTSPDGATIDAGSTYGHAHETGALWQLARCLRLADAQGDQWQLAIDAMDAGVVA